MNSLKVRAISSLFWSFTEQFSLQIIMFVVSVVLARMLLPEDFGLIAMPAVFLSIGMSLRDSGLSSSLIRTINPSDSDYTTVFYMNITLSILVYFLIFFTAPLIADFYQKPLLTEIVRVQSIIIIIGAISSIQHTRLTKSMSFKKQMSIQVPSVVISALFGIWFAYLGFGVWSLVYMNLIQYSVAALHFWISSDWRPSKNFDIKKMKEHLSFGSKITVSGILEVLYENFYTIIIGKYFGAALLGFYARAKSTQELPIKNSTAALNKVTYSLFCEIQDDDKRLKEIYSKIMQQILFWIIPTLIVAAIIAEPLFIFVFTEKWLPAVPIFQFLCFVGILSPLNIYNLSILKVKGRSDLYLITEIINKSYIVIFAIFLISFGLEALLYFQIVSTFISFLINSYISGKLISFGPIEQIKNIFPIFVVGLIMGVITLLLFQVIERYISYDLLQVIATSLIGFGVYFLLAMIFKLKPLDELILIISKKRKKVVR